MKKFLFALGALILSASAMAATQQLAVGNKAVKLPADAQLQQLKSVGSALAVDPVEKNGKLTKAPRKNAPRKLVAASTLEGEWNCTYTGLLNNNLGSHEGTATLEWIDDYEQFEIFFPDYSSLPFYADYNEESASLVFNAEILMQSGGMYVAQCPLNGTSPTGTPLVVPYNEATGAFEFPSNSGLAFVAMTGMSLSTIQGYYWAGNNITLEKPDGDYSLKIAFDEECTPDNKFYFTVTTGADIAQAYAITWEGDLAAADFAEYYEDYIPLLGQPVQDGTYNIEPQMEEGSGYYTIMLFGYNEAGALVKTTQDCVYVTVDEDDVYQTIGTVPYNDTLVNGYYNSFTNDKEAVEIQENINTPGLFRLVNAYDGQVRIHDAECNHYIYLDARDADFVNIPASNTGLDFGDGMLVIGTYGGALGYTKQECALYKYPTGSLAGRVITFPVKSVLAHEKRYNAPGSWSSMNPNKVMTITLPDLVLNVSAVSGADNSPLAGVTVVVEPADGGDAYTDAEVVTDAEGKVTVTLPASVDYLATVNVTVTDADGNTETREVKLNGASNDVSFTLGKPAIPEDAFVVYTEGTVNPDLHVYGWWNDSANFKATAPDGTADVFEFKAGAASATDASMGINMEKPLNTGILHAATLNFDWYAVGSGKYTIRLTSQNEENYDFTVTAETAGKWNTTSLDVAEVYPLVAEQWNEDSNLGEGYVFSVVLSNGSEGDAIYFRNIYYTGVDNEWEAPEHQVVAPESIPTPTHPAADVLSIFSDAYQSTYPFWAGGWGQSTSMTEVEIDGKKAEWIRNFNYLGWEFGDVTIDVSAYDYMHVDFWTATEGAGFAFSPVTREGTAKEKCIAQVVNSNQWNSYDVPLATWTAEGLDLATVFQIKFDGGVQGEEGYIANVYFYKEGGEIAGDITGTMTYQVDMDMAQFLPDVDLADPENIEVTATYADGKLTIYNFAELNPITFDLDATTGAMTAEGQIAYVDDYEPDNILEYYYSDIETAQSTVYAQAYSTEDNKTEIIVKPWGEGMDFPGYGWFFNSAYFNTVVTLDLAIEGLPGKPAEETEDHSAIEGEWSFTLDGHYIGDWSLGQFTETFTASVEGDVVTFLSSGSPYNIVAEFTDASTLLFSLRPVGNPATYTLWQAPYVNETGVNDIEELTIVPFTATFNAEEGTITFPEHSGLRYGFFSEEKVLSYWDDAFDFVSAVKGQAPVKEPAIALGEVVATVEDGTLYVVFRYETVNIAPDAVVKAVITSNTDETFSYDTTVSDGLGYITFDNFEAGTYTVVLLAYDAENNVIATSNEQTYTVAQSGVAGIDIDASDVRYFNLQGVEITNPTAGNVYIRVQGSTAVKVIVNK